MRTFLFCILLGGFVFFISNAFLTQHKRGLEIFAISYASEFSFPVSKLFDDYPNNIDRRSIGNLFYLIRLNNKRILIDTGFRDSYFQKKWRISNLFEIGELLSQVGESPSTITDIILTHGHIDHAGNVDLFPQANIWITEREFLLLDKSEVMKRKLPGLKWKTYENFKNLFGVIDLYRVGGHTRGSAVVELKWHGQRFLFPGDNCYLEENCRKRLFVGAVESRQDNRLFINGFYRYPGRILPHHDPLVMSQGKKINSHITLIYKD